MNQQEEVKQFQRQLNHNREEQSHFIDAELSDLSYSEDEQEIRVVAPKRRQKKNGRMDEMMMEQLLKQQNAYLKAQKKIYELQTEIDTEEVKTRYVKLDLNNAQVKVEELEKKLMYLSNVKMEVWVMRVIFVLYFVFRVYMVIMMNAGLQF